MKRRLLPPCTALVLCLLLAPAAWAAVYPYPPIETLHIGSHDGTEIQKDTYYLVRGETVTTQGANADNYNIYYKDGTLTLRAAALPDYLLVPGETTIHLVGENTIGTKDSPTDVGIQGVTPGAITITGPGSCSIHSSAEGIITVQPDSATDPQVTSDIRLQGGTINTNGSSISTRYGGICITGSAQVTSGSLSTGGDPNTEEAQRARDLVISGRASVTAERLSALQQIQITGSATVTVENPAGIAINGNRGIAISDQARVTAIGTTGGLNAFSGPITIDSTGKTIAQATDTTRNYAAISMGQGDSALSLLTIRGETAVSGAVGIGSSQGSILIDASALEITATYAGIINSTSSSETKITVQNSAQVSITCSGPKGISASSGTVEIADSTVTVQAASSAYTALPTLTYTDSYQVTAGAEAGSPSGLCSPGGCHRAARHLDLQRPDGCRGGPGRSGHRGRAGNRHHHRQGRGGLRRLHRHGEPARLLRPHPVSPDSDRAYTRCPLRLSHPAQTGRHRNHYPRPRPGLPGGTSDSHPAGRHRPSGDRPRERHLHLLSAQRPGDHHRHLFPPPL